MLTKKCGFYFGLVIAVVAMLIACEPEKVTTRKAAKAKTDKDADVVGPGTGTGTGTGTGSVIKTSTETLIDEEFRMTCSETPQNVDSTFSKIHGTKLMVVQGGAKKSLCNVLSESKKAAVLFQFIDDTCDQCVKAAENMELRLSYSPYQYAIAHVMVMVGKDETKMKALQDAIAKVAPSRLWVVDETKELWMNFGAYKDKVHPTFLAMNANMEAALVKEPNGQYLDVVSKAEELIKAYDESIQPKTPPAQKSVSVDWDMKSFTGTKQFNLIPIQ